MMKQFLAVLTLLVLLTGFGCDISQSNEGYTNVEINNKLGHYSLEYPAIYQKEIRDDLRFRVPYTYLVFEYPIQTVTAEIFDPETGEIRTISGMTGVAEISITISNYKLEFGDSYTASVKLDSILQGASKWDNYILLERSSTLVSGLEGETVKYLQDRLMPMLW